MRLIRQSAQVIPQKHTLDGAFKQIELAGRTAYKSEDRITEDSAKKFVDMLIKREHPSPLEHGTIYLKIPILYEQKEINEQIEKGIIKEEPVETWNFYLHNPYSKVFDYDDRDFFYVATNYRVMVENSRNDYHYMFIPKADEMPVSMMRYSVKIVCSIGIGRELTRHRQFSFLQESTRFVNYSKDKFGNELTFILPSEYDIDGETTNEYRYAQALKLTEDYYIASVSSGVPPERARDMLPLATKTELMMTGFIGGWEDFFKLRLTPQAHPDMRELAEMIRDALNEQLKEEGFKYQFTDH